MANNNANNNENVKLDDKKIKTEKRFVVIKGRVSTKAGMIEKGKEIKVEYLSRAKDMEELIKKGFVAEEVKK